jgi:predicted PurR-regulated permease PerM
MTDNGQRFFFMVLLFAVSIAFVWLIRGFLQPIFWAIALGIVVYPLHQRIQARLGHWRSAAAAISMLLVVVIVVIPIGIIVATVTNEAVLLYDRVQAGQLSLAGIYDFVEQRFPELLALLQKIDIDPEKLQSQLSAGATQVTQFVASRAIALGQDTLRITVFFFLMLYLLFFFLRDGQKLLEGLVRALPLGNERERHLLGRFAEVSRATIKGSLVVGIVQGAIGGIAFAILGIGSPVLWGVIMALLSIIPAVGPAFVWLPAAIFLFTGGQVVSGIVLVLIGTLVIGLVDNFLRPLLVGRDTKMPDYLILLSTLGGLAAFGLAGVVIGPIIAAFFLSIWAMAEETPLPAMPATSRPNPARQAADRGTASGSGFSRAHLRSGAGRNEGRAEAQVNRVTGELGIHFVPCSQRVSQDHNIGARERCTTGRLPLGTGHELRAQISRSFQRPRLNTQIATNATSESATAIAT